MERESNSSSTMSFEPSSFLNENQRKTKPKFVVSESGKIEDQYYHTRTGSRAWAYLKNRIHKGDSLHRTTNKSLKHVRCGDLFTDSDILHMGYLVKLGSYWKTWRKRYFILRRDRPVLYYFSSSEDLTRLGDLELDLSTKLIRCATSQRPYQFIIRTDKRELVLDADDGGEIALEGWMSALQYVISSSGRSSVETPPIFDKTAFSTAFASGNTSSSMTSDHVERIVKSRSSDPEPYQNLGGLPLHSLEDTKRNSATHLTSQQLNQSQSPNSSAISSQYLSYFALSDKSAFQVGVAVGTTGAQTRNSMCVVVSKDSKTKEEICRTEYQSADTLRSIAHDHLVRDFSTLLPIPADVGPQILFSIYSIHSLSSESLDSQELVSEISVSVNDLLLLSTPLVLEMKMEVPISGCMGTVLIVETFPSQKMTTLGINYPYASRNFIAETATGEGISRRNTIAAMNGISRADWHQSIRRRVSVVEELSASPLSISVACAFLHMLQIRNSTKLQEAVQLRDGIRESLGPMLFNAHADANHSTSIKELRDRFDDALTQISHYELLHCEYEKFRRFYTRIWEGSCELVGADLSSCLRKSTQKKYARMHFIPINLNFQLMKAAYVYGKNQTDSSKEFITITHGAVAAHTFGFKDGGLRRMFNQSSRTDTINGEPLWQRFQRRQDVVHCQILGVASSCFLAVVSLTALGSPLHKKQLLIASKVGFLINIESLLSTIGNEMGMLEDMSVAVKWLRDVSFQTILLMSERTIPQCVSITTDSDNQILVTFALPADQFQSLPQHMKEGHTVPVTAVLFTQGINEMQTVANSVFDVSLQKELNMESLEVLLDYFLKYKETVISSKLGSEVEMEAMHQSLLSLQRTLWGQGEDGSKKSRSQRKNVNILIESSDLCRRMGAARTVCCKSGKDRTAMSVTLECTRILVENFEVKQGIKLCQAMRSCGVRRKNVLYNTGKTKYAFNSLQLVCLPHCYQPPPSTADSRVAS